MRYCIKAKYREKISQRRRKAMKDEKRAMTEEEKNRRELLKTSAVLATAGMVGGLGIAQEGLAAEQSPLRSPLKQARVTSVNANAKLVMPDGSVKTRAEVLSQLGLNPNTPPDAWLAGCGGGCGSNASALDMKTRENLMRRGFKFRGNELISSPAMKSR
jgi:hypothetical protein